MFPTGTSKVFMDSSYETSDGWSTADMRAEGCVRSM